MRRKLISILFLFVIAMTVSFAFPKEARAAAPTVKMGNVALKNDAKWHAYNAKAPTISGWTAGKYRLSTDGKTLELNGIKYSGSKRGIYSSAALTVKTTGTNTFTCKGARGIGLGTDDDNLKNLTLTGASGSVLNLKCTDARSICVNSCTLKSGTVNATGAGYCDANYSQSGGKLNLTGTLQTVENIIVSGGTVIASGNLAAGLIEGDSNGYGWSAGYIKISKGTVSAKNFNVTNGMTIEGGTITASGNLNVGPIGEYLTEGSLKITNGTINCNNVNISNNLIFTAGTLTAKGFIRVDESATISGGNISANNYARIMGNYKQTAGTANISKHMSIVGEITFSGGVLTIADNCTANSIILSGGTINAKSGFSVHKNFSGSGGTFTASTGLNVDGNMTLTGANVTASTQGIYVGEKLTISKGTLTGKATSDTMGIDVQGNSTVSGTAKVIASSGNSNSFRTIGTLTVSGGTVEASNVATPNSENGAYSNLDAGTFIATGGTVIANANGTAGRAISVEKTMTIKGGAITGFSKDLNNSWGTIIAEEGITVSGGTLTGTGTASSGIYTPKNINVSGTATVNATSKDSVGLYASENINVSGGTVNAKSDNSNALWADLLTVTAGTVTGSGKYAGINANNIKISGGNVYGESRESNGILAYESFEMTGGKLTGKTAGEWSDAIYAYSENGNISIADDIWLSAPSEGYTRLQGNNYLRIYDSNHNIAKEATLQKVKDISVKSGPTTQMYREDYFNPVGISLDVTFADGTKSVVPYYYNTREMFTFSIPEDEALSVGTKSLTINCLTKTASTNFTVKDLRAPYISGTTSVDRIDLTWKPVEGAAYYRVYAKEEGADYFSMIGYVRADTKFTDNNLSPGTTKEYYVTAYRWSTSYTVINSDASNTLKLTTELHAPVIMISGNTYDSLTVKWDAVDGAGEYRIYRKDGAQGYEEVTVTEECEYTDTGLITGKEYTYYVIAATENDLVRSEASGEAAGTPSFKGGTTLRVSNNKKSYDLSWKAVDGATAYEIFRGNGANGGRSRIATVEGISFTDNGASCYSTYNYTVLPIRMAGNRKFSGEESAAVVSKPIVKTNFTDKEIEKAKVDKTIRKLSRIITTASFSKKTMTVNYEKVKGAYDYRIEYKKRGEKSWKKKWTAKKNKYVIKGMKKGQFLEFRVAAFKYKDGKLVRGNYSAMSYRWYVTAKARLKAGKKSFKLNINKVRGATGYRVFYRDANGKGNEKNKFSKSPNVTIKGLKKGHTYIVEYRPVKKIGGHEYKGILVTKKVKVK